MIDFTSIQQMLEDTKTGGLPLWQNIMVSDCARQGIDRTLSWRQMERLLDATKFPQAFSTPRAFGASAAGKGSAAVGTGPRTGKIATFTVRVIFRQNASWQGSVAWLEGGSEQRFRSVLELLLLLDSALTSVNRMEKSS